MKLKNKILIGCSIVLLVQLIVFKDYISPFQWGQIKVTGLNCTCPDETVISGVFYLKRITPDSLKKYNLDYSEVYVTERPATNSDLLGTDDYIIEGTVIGKDRIDEEALWNPVVKVEKWRPLNFFVNWVVKFVFFGQLLILAIVLISRKGNDKVLPKVKVS